MGQGLILVYSVTSRSSFNFLEDIHQSVRRPKQDNPIFILVGNQCDKTKERQVSKADGAALARQYGCDFIETSAKTNQNLERLFINIASVHSLRQTRQTSDHNVKARPLSICEDREDIMRLCYCVGRFWHCWALDSTHHFFESKTVSSSLCLLCLLICFICI